MSEEEEQTEDLNTPETLPDIPADEVEQAKADGIKQQIADNAAHEFSMKDGNLENPDSEPGITPTYDVFHLQDIVDLEPKALKAKLDGKDGTALSEGQIAALLEVERSGKNRTDVVAVFCKRLGIASPYEVTDAGPNYTNDVNRSVVKPRA